MPAYSKVFLGVLVAVVIAYGLTAYLIDPRGDFAAERFPTVLFDARREKVKSFAKYNEMEPVTGIILGSSRSMKLAGRRLDTATGRRWFNFSVDSARVEDYVAIYNWATNTKLHSKI